MNLEKYELKFKNDFTTFEQETILFSEKLALAKKQFKGIKLPPNKNDKQE